ncbi:MAG: hypothetical protein MJ252_10340 [archaeon]|nr:hypothetical protein [archaeon]
MEFSDEYLQKITKHDSKIVSIFQLPQNNELHMLSLSEDGLLKEWYINGKETVELGKCFLIRPSHDVLVTNKHPVPKVAKGDYIPISQAITFNNFIVLGYDDGLVLVYQQEVKDARVEDDESASGLGEEEKEGENPGEEEKEGEENKETEKKGTEGQNEEKKDEEGENEKNEEITHPSKKEIPLSTDLGAYTNYFNLYYILLGHTQTITSLFYEPTKNILVTSSENFIIKIFDMETANSLYQFNLDCIVNRTLAIQRGKDINLVFICQDPYKLVLNISRDPYSFNHFTFKENEIESFTKTDTNEYFCLGPQRVAYKFNKFFEEPYEFVDNIDTDYQHVIKYNKDFLIFDKNCNMRHCSYEITEEEKKKGKLTYDFKINIDNELVCEHYFLGKTIIVGTLYGQIYTINADAATERLEELKRFKEEEAIADELAKQVAAAKKKKKGKGKGKRGKSATKKLPKVKEKGKKK